MIYDKHAADCGELHKHYRLRTALHNLVHHGLKWMWREDTDEFTFKYTSARARERVEYEFMHREYDFPNVVKMRK